MSFRILRDEKFALSFLKDDRGSMITIFALVLVPMLLMAGMALDFGRAYKGKAAVTKTLDAGLLYVASLYSVDKTIDVDKELEDYFARTFSDVGVQNLNLTATVSTNGSDFTGNATGKVLTTLMRLAHINEVNFNVNAKVSLPKMEVVMVLDNTGSMNGAKMATLKIAAKDLIDELMPAGPSEKMKIGIVPYAQYVNIGTGKQGQSWLKTPSSGWAGWKGCVGSRSSPLDTEDSSYGTKVPAVHPDPIPWVSNTCPISKVKELSKTKADLKSVIDGMDADGYTYIPGGLVWGWRLLSDQAPFTEGAAVSNSITKAIILMTDGDNTVKPSYPKHDICGNSCGSQPDNITRSMCDNIKAAGITVYTVAFQVASGSTGEGLMQYCASNPANYYPATSNAALKTAFKNIAKSLLRLRVTG